MEEPQPELVISYGMLVSQETPSSTVSPCQPLCISSLSHSIDPSDNMYRIHISQIGKLNLSTDFLYFWPEESGKRCLSQMEKKEKYHHSLEDFNRTLSNRILKLFAIWKTRKMWPFLSNPDIELGKKTKTKTKKIEVPIITTIHEIRVNTLNWMEYFGTNSKIGALWRSIQMIIKKTVLNLEMQIWNKQTNKKTRNLTRYMGSIAHKQRKESLSSKIEHLRWSYLQNR